MKQIFTPNDLLRYLYKEMDPAEESSLKNQLESDPALAQEFHLLLDGVAMLEQAEVSPGRALVQDLVHKLHLNTEEHSV